MPNKAIFPWNKLWLYQSKLGVYTGKAYILQVVLSKPFTVKSSLPIQSENSDASLDALFRHVLKHSALQSMTICALCGGSLYDN